MTSLLLALLAVLSGMTATGGMIAVALGAPRRAFAVACLFGLAALVLLAAARAVG